MDGIFKSIVMNQNKSKIVELYRTIVSSNNIERHDLNDFCLCSWDHICLTAPLSSLVIKMIADTHKIDWRDVLSLQFYDQLYCVNSYISQDSTSSVRAAKDQTINVVIPIENKKRKSHCVGFACQIDNAMTGLEASQVTMNGQTWDVNPKYTDVEMFKYPIATTISHHGIFGGPYISSN